MSTDALISVVITLLMFGVIIYLVFIAARSMRTQQSAISRVDEGMEISRRTLKLSEEMLAEQKETNQLLARLLTDLKK